eukprot:3556543-Pleurochrysis_carterae.AAC.1
MRRGSACIQHGREGGVGMCALRVGLGAVRVGGARWAERTRLTRDAQRAARSLAHRACTLSHALARPDSSPAHASARLQARTHSRSHTS